eukprot:160851-Pleurochrysis_carterae.AAC.1
MHTLVHLAYARMVAIDVPEQAQEGAHNLRKRASTEWSRKQCKVYNGGIGSRHRAVLHVDKDDMEVLAD